MRNTLYGNDIWDDTARLPERARVGELRVVVACGGIGPEREISLATGEAVRRALDGAVREAVMLDVESEEPERFLSGLAGFDVVFAALHGPFGEDGTFQEILEAEGVRFTGSGSAASRLAFDKRESKRVFDEAGVPTPRFVVLGEREISNAREAEGLVRREVGFPVVVKPACSGSSVGVGVVREPSGLGRALETALAGSPPDRKAVVAEELVEGEEVTLGVLAGRPLPLVRLAPAREFYDFEAKYRDERTEYEVPADLDREVVMAAVSAGMGAFEALGCREYGRVDVMLDSEGNPFVLEVNTIPGMTSHSLLPKAAAAAGIDFRTLCSVIVALAVLRGEG